MSEEVEDGSFPDEQAANVTSHLRDDGSGNKCLCITDKQFRLYVCLQAAECQSDQLTTAEDSGFS